MLGGPGPESSQRRLAAVGVCADETDSYHSSETDLRLICLWLEALGVRLANDTPVPWVVPHIVWQSPSSVVLRAVSDAICRGIRTAIRRGILSATCTANRTGVLPVAGRIAGHVPCRVIGKATVHIPLSVALPAIPPVIREAIRPVVPHITVGVQGLRNQGGRVASNDNPEVRYQRPEIRMGRSQQSGAFVSLCTSGRIPPRQGCSPASVLSLLPLSGRRLPALASRW